MEAVAALRRRCRSKPTPLSHYLKPAELTRLWMATEEAPGLQSVYRYLMRFLLCVPCRLNEARTMDRAHLDLDAAAWPQLRISAEAGPTSDGPISG